MATQAHKATFYNESYKQPNYFRYQSWLYEPYISSLIRFCGLQKGASVLDVGCGQGFFSYLFRKNGMRVHGVDISETGILAARRTYGDIGITFSVLDAQTAKFQDSFDCIFVRSCTLYNTSTFPDEKEITNNLLKHLKPTGIFIFAYNSNFSLKASPAWRYHSLEDVSQHFSRYRDPDIFFFNKTMPYLLRRFSFTSLVKHINVFLSRTCGVGGDLICILKKPRPTQPKPE